MAYSLGLTLYNLANRGVAEAEAPRPPRPSGRLVWLHAPSGDSLPQMIALARRLQDQTSVAVLLTSPVLPVSLPRHLTGQPPPDDNPTEARRFLDHWSPDIAVIGEGELRPALLHEAQERGIPLTLVEGRNPHWLRGREGWWPGLMRSLLAGFRAVLTIDESGARAFRRAGASPGTVRASGHLEYPSSALPCTEAERTELARILATRPVWFAAALPESEEAHVIAAHRAALKLAHRLLLIIAPEDPTRIPALAERLEKIEGWTVARRGEDQEPDDEVQVYIADSAVEFGLWYRLAPITFVGGTLSPGGARRDPMEPAALGSAIIHGPRAGRHGAVIGRLAAAQATSLIGSAADMAEALGELLAPDRSARLAQAAWTVVSDGEAASAEAVRMITTLLESPE